MKRIYKDRLLKLANHLEKGKLAHKKFDYSVFSASVKPIPEGSCGSRGCALGECPAIFKDWKWEHSDEAGDQYPDQVIPVYKNEDGARQSADVFFGLNGYQRDRLFFGYGNIGGQNLKQTRRQVARKIKAFVLGA